MKAPDTLAVTAGVTAGSVLSHSAEQIVASIGAALAVYIAKAVLGWMIRRFKIPLEPDN